MSDNSNTEKLETKTPEVVGGRKTRRVKVTIDDIRQMEALSGMGLNRDQICAILDISRVVFDSRLKEDDQIHNAIERGRALALQNVMKTAYQLAVSGECPAMTMFYLKTRARWRESHHIDITAIESSSDLISKDQQIRMAKAVLEENQDKPDGNQSDS